MLAMLSSWPRLSACLDWDFCKAEGDTVPSNNLGPHDWGLCANSHKDCKDLQLPQIRTFTSLKSCKWTNNFFQLPNYAQQSLPVFFPPSPDFSQEGKPKVLPGYRPIWPMTCHLTLLSANALPSTTSWAPAGQLARLLVWSSANGKPRETSVHLNSQMGGQRGGEKQ